MNVCWCADPECKKRGCKVRRVQVFVPANSFDVKVHAPSDPKPEAQIWDWFWKATSKGHKFAHNDNSGKR